MFDGVLLGDDEHGTWVGFRAGTRFARPGSEFVASDDHVTLVPAEGHFLATFWPDGRPVDPTGGDIEVYVDVATPGVWDGATLHTVDLDLDVIRRGDGTVFVDDEDEFAQHQVAFGYPPDLVATARTTCAALLDDVRRREPPFDPATAASWLAILRGLPRRGG